MLEYSIKNEQKIGINTQLVFKIKKNLLIFVNEKRKHVE